MAGYPGNPVVSGTLSLSASTDLYATHWDINGRGGVMGIVDVTTMNAIPSQRRNWGMIVVVYADGVSANNKSYQLCNIALGGASNTITDNSNWIDYKIAALGISGLSQGDILVANSTPTLVRFAKGTSDQVLAMNHAGTTLEYKTVSNGITSNASGIKLGGTLGASPTIINLGSGNLTFGNSGTTPIINLAPGNLGMSSQGVFVGMQSNIDLFSNGTYGVRTTDTSGPNHVWGTVSDSSGIHTYFSFDTSGITSSTRNSIYISATGIDTLFNGTVRQRLTTNGFYFGASTATAVVHLPAVTTSASTAPIKFTLGGTLMTTSENGALEAINSHIYWTDSTGTRRQLDQQGGSSLTIAGIANEIQTNNGSSNLGAGKIFNPSNGNITLGDNTISGGRTILVSSSSSNASLVLSSQGTSSSVVIQGTSWNVNLNTSTPGTGILQLTGNADYTIGGYFLLTTPSGNVTNTSGTDIKLLGSSAYQVSGNGNGGNIILQGGANFGSGISGKIITRSTLQFGDSTTTGPYFITTTTATGTSDLIIKPGATDLYFRISRKGVGEQYPYLILGASGASGDDDTQVRVITTQGQISGTPGVATATLALLAGSHIFSDEGRNIQSSGSRAASGTLTFFPSSALVTLGKTSDGSGIFSAGGGTSSFHTGGTVFLKGSNAYSGGGATDADGGHVNLIPGSKFGTGKKGNIQLLTNPNTFGLGEGVIYISQVVTLPTTSISSGGVMYIKSDNKPYWWTGTTEYSMTGGGGGGSYSAGNGLMLTGTVFSLGGTITANTYFEDQTAGAHSFRVGNTVGFLDFGLLTDDGAGNTDQITVGGGSFIYSINTTSIATGVNFNINDSVGNSNFFLDASSFNFLTGSCQVNFSSYASDDQILLAAGGDSLSSGLFTDGATVIHGVIFTSGPRGNPHVRLNIDRTGAWLLGVIGSQLAGTTGQVLTSNGVGTAPTWQTVVGGGSVSTVSVITANGVSGSVANATTTPAITLTLGAITPITVNSVTISGSSTPSLSVIGTSSITGTNTGDQTTITGNAGTATALQTGRTINGTSFNGTTNITITADANTLTNTTLNSTVVSSSLTSVGIIGTGTWQGTLVAGQYGGTGVNNSGKTITLGGNLTTSGAFATTLTITAATNVTFPTTGTLSTLAGTENLTNKTYLLGFNPQTGNYPLVLADSSKGVIADSVSNINITIPLNATVAFPIGVTIPIFIKNTGGITIVPTGGVTIRPSAGTGILTATVQNSVVYLVQNAIDDWYVLNGSPSSGGSGGVTIQNISSSSTITTAANTTYTIFVDATSGNVVLTLPTGSSTTGHWIRRIDTSSNTVTFSGSILGFGTSTTNLIAGAGFFMSYNGTSFYAN